MRKNIIILFSFIGVTNMVAQIKTDTTKSSIIEELSILDSLKTNVKDQITRRPLKIKFQFFDSTITPSTYKNNPLRNNNSLYFRDNNKNNFTDPKGYMIKGLLNYVPGISFKL
ncbi:hypothetical protein CMU93_14720 [Elizabethkingia anophelis]|nr:hypothetical protein [Elizabethkingia anophelis]